MVCVTVSGHSGGLSRLVRQFLPVLLPVLVSHSCLTQSDQVYSVCCCLSVSVLLPRRLPTAASAHVTRVSALTLTEACCVRLKSVPGPGWDRRVVVPVRRLRASRSPCRVR